MNYRKLFFCATVLTACVFASNSIVIPDNPPTVSGGELTKGEGMENTAVNQSNLDDFIKLYKFAFTGDDYYNDNSAVAQNARSARSQSNLPDERESFIGGITASSTGFGSSSGKVEFMLKAIFEESNRGAEERGVYEIKYFDFSNAESFFMGGAVGIFVSNAYEDGVEHDIVKKNGTIDFRGKYEGQIVFENVAASRDSLENKITSGRFFVKSGNVEINLPIYLLFSYIQPSTQNRIYGDDTPIDRTMPAVPTAPSGELTSRGGATITAANLEDFLEIYAQELEQRNSRAGRGFELFEDIERLRHGEENGYVSTKERRSEIANDYGCIRTTTTTREFFNFSNLGNLYLGGGYGRSAIHGWEDFCGWYSNESRDEFKYNGRINFNGELAGSLSFQNFHYIITEQLEQVEVSGSWQWKVEREVILKNGRVVLNDTLDITEEYVLIVLGISAEDLADDRPTLPPLSISRNNSSTNRNVSVARFAGIRNGQIHLNLAAGNYTAELYNLQGRMVSRANITAINGVNAVGLRTDNIAQGVFILNVKQNGVSVLRHRINVRR
ncbi:MAG: T9SS type A sorting domain-containing protein [Chitinivibrionia bacterium]|nr:T9SS type A sorting domain-containing protein [Chitinivibrionia bacterium]